MNLNESEFEEELRTLRPRPASSALESRIAAALGSTAPHPHTGGLRVRPKHVLADFWSALGWAGAGAALAIAVIALVHALELPAAHRIAPPDATANAPALDSFKHTEESAELIGAADEGLILETNEEPVRQVRYNSLERHVWINAMTGARMEIEIPREDVRFMPVVLQ
ncbi:MAG: hypothetical protein QOE70_1773 [Chthoniobacter sp.]|jgi:hypothetical protein|nr:hypothetical protein [Chthoniobacter sp.]